MRRSQFKMIIVYAEGVYVDHRYYENQYEDTVMGTGNTAGSDARYRGLGNPFKRTKKRIAMYFCNAFFGLMLFGFQNHFSSLSSATSVYCLFAGFSFLSLFIVVRIGTVVREVGFLFTKASYSIAASDRLCKTCPISALMQTDCRSISCGQTACPWLMQT